MKTILKFALTAVCYFIFSLPAVAQELSVATVEKMDQLLAKYGDDTPGASVLVSRAGEIIYERYVGMADLEHGVPVTGTSIFEAGSVSKQFTAAGILLLVQEGKVDLDAEIQQYLPEVPVYERPITVRHLFNHTSGLKDWGSLAGLGGWSRGTRVYTNDIALQYIIRQPDLNYLPGDEYLYSNSNYTLMTILLERVSGQSLTAFTAEHFFKPIGMEQTSWRTDYRDVVAGRAIGYGLMVGSGGASASGGANAAYRMNMPFENTYGHAALLTTVRDLNRWNESWYQPSADQALRILREQQGVLTSGDTIAYAAGVRIAEHNGRKVVNHSGATAGYRAWLAYYPEDELSIVFLSNDANAQITAIGEGLADVLLAPQREVGSAAAAVTSATSVTPEQTIAPLPPDESLLKQLPGEYHSTAVEGKWTVASHNGGLTIQVHPHSRLYSMQSIAVDQFSATGLGRLQIIKEADGSIKGFYVTIDRARNVWFEKSGL